MRAEPSKPSRPSGRASRAIPGIVAASLALAAVPAAAQADEAALPPASPETPPQGAAPTASTAPLPEATAGTYGDAATPTSGPAGEVTVQPDPAPAPPAATPTLQLEPAPRPEAPRPRRPRKRSRGQAEPLHRAGPPAPTAAPPVPNPMPAVPSAPGRPVPDSVLSGFQIPPFLLPVYQAAATAYEVPWQVLAAINSIETDYGRNLNSSSAGAVGWMQFMPATWERYGVDANLDGHRDPLNPADAIFAAARYLNAAGAAHDLRGAIFAYNHADWYVADVLRRADAIERLPGALIDSLTGLAEARFPIPGNDVRYSTRERPRRWAVLHGPAGRRVLAVADGKIVSLGTDPRLGRFVVLEDAYGNRFTYAHLGGLNRLYAVPKRRALSEAQIARELHLPRRDSHPRAPATAGRQLSTAEPGRAHPVALAAPEPSGLASELLVARRGALHAALEPPVPHSALLAGARALGLPPERVAMRPLRRGARVVAGTVLGHIGARLAGRGAPVEFAVRPAGHGSPRVDAGPLLRGWRQLQRAKVFGPAGTSTLEPDGSRGLGRGKALLLPKEALGRRVLADERIHVYQCGRQDVATGQIDRRVLATLEFLADEGLDPTVSALKCGHSLYTASGNISEHSTGDAVDIAAINGIPIVGHQGPGSITETTIRKLLLLQGTMKPHQIISLMTFQGADNTFSMADHYDHIHVGFRPAGGAVTQGILEPRQWERLMGRLAGLPTPRVRRHVSRFALPAKRG